MMRVLGLVMMATLIGSAGTSRVAADDAPSASATPACYDLRVETLMPHLEDNLRYANTQETQCVTRAELHRLFPVLSHPALSGCHLAEEQRVAEGWSLQLACDVDHGTHGTAVWQVVADGEVGELTVRLGGKNMTFSQRLTARLNAGRARSR